MILQKQYHFEALNQILKPSLLSGTLAVLAGLIVTGGIIIIFSASNSQIQQQIEVWQKPAPVASEPALTTPDQVLKENDKPTLKGSWPLLIFWSGLGLAVYVIAMLITRSIADAAKFGKSLSYEHANKHVLLQSAVLRIVLRIFIIGLGIFFAIMFYQKVIPYSVTVAQASTANLVSAEGVVFALISFLSVALGVHLLTVFARLSIGRVRVFSGVV